MHARRVHEFKAKLDTYRCRDGTSRVLLFFCMLQLGKYTHPNVQEF